MKRFNLTKNKYLKMDIPAYYNCEYLGYGKKGNPDFINKLKNSEGRSSELDLVREFIEVEERVQKDLSAIISNCKFNDLVVCVVPRSKRETSYKQSQLMFKKAVSSAIKQLGIVDGSGFIKRTKDTKTTHNWRSVNNTGEMPYVGISSDTCEFNSQGIKNKNIILVDDVYTKNVNIVEDFVQSLFDLGAKNVILYVVAKTRD